MRIQTLILYLFLCVASAFAKDVITKTDGTKLDAKVEEITETVIKYRKASNPTGPVYTIPISSVATVLYENGDMDSFNVSSGSSPVSSSQQISNSDDELIQLYNSQGYSDQYLNVSDAQLIKMSTKQYSAEELYVKAKKFKKIGWIGGGSLLVVGIGVGIGVWSSWGFDSGDFTSGFLAPVGISLVAGAIWTLGFNMKANSLTKQARQMQSYSATLIENQIMQFGDNSLTAGINVMGNRMVNSHSLGLSLGLNF
ncbi:MAG: hypothetical protein HDS27_06110 [Bacteroides sp.]|nr:hypothetical protein [Bacteroides sp.]